MNRCAGCGEDVRRACRAQEPPAHSAGGALGRQPQRMSKPGTGGPSSAGPACTEPRQTAVSFCESHISASACAQFLRCCFLPLRGCFYTACRVWYFMHSCRPVSRAPDNQACVIWTPKTPKGAAELSRSVCCTRQGSRPLPQCPAMILHSLHTAAKLLAAGRRGAPLLSWGVERRFMCHNGIIASRAAAHAMERSCAQRHLTPSRQSASSGPAAGCPGPRGAAVGTRRTARPSTAPPQSTASPAPPSIPGGPR